ncbi:unnamed protein product [Owenia fusiformis]|uniref:Uncharacterized protein n=1 Tax=Owenia fusiformis TaxID=6347 RepID=A0A8S4NL55_OWEFU|nr:unnamed protein product [Owenia fusiformis]
MKNADIRVKEGDGICIDGELKVFSCGIQYEGQRAISVFNTIFVGRNNTLKSESLKLGPLTTILLHDILEMSKVDVICACDINTYMPTIYGPKERSTDVYDFQGDDSDTDSEAGLIRGERVEEDETEEEQTENETEEEQTENETEEEQTENETEEEQTENETEEEQTENGLTITDSALLPSTAKLPEVIGSLNLLHKKFDKLIGLIQPTTNVSSNGAPTPTKPTRPSSPTRAQHTRSPVPSRSATSATSSSPPIFDNNHIWNCTPAQLLTNNGQITKEH